MKKQVTKTLALLLILLMVFSMTACGSKKEDSKTYKIGVCQLVQHTALDAATQGFVDALNALLPDQVEIDVKNASGEANNCATIVNTFVSDSVDLIMANATPALTAAASATDSIPILGTSVTAYNVALDLDNFTGVVGGNISGTSDLADFDQQAEMIQAWFPSVKKIGFLFCSAEANSRYQVDEMTARLTKMGYTCSEFAFTDSNDVTAVSQSAAGSSDLIYIPTDNTAASNIEAISNVLLTEGVPMVGGEEGLIGEAGVCCLTISYYDLGYTTGEMAAKILKGEAKISEMAIGYTKVTPKYNKTIAAKYNLTPVSGYAAIE